MKQPLEFLEMKQAQEKIAMITAYDYPSAKDAEKAGVDLILVGDSLGMVVLGYDSTIPVTLADMIHHTKAVKRGAPNTFIVTDMPYMSYHASIEDTIWQARKLIQESGTNAIKLEGAGRVVEKIAALTEAGAPVVAHLGLTPQTVGLTGSYKVRAKAKEEAAELMEQALRIEQAGAIMLVLEAIPKQLAEKITNRLHIPVIGIGAGVKTDGQVLVFHDVIGYGISRRAKFVKAYLDIDEPIISALIHYVSDVKKSYFPEDKHSFTMKAEDIIDLYGGENK
ncbi:3-methyl-2-oxobutanoate hydroxymethyltransferase [Listeria sp. PSOL-1]|uniref:3-methyl-2-oxobutanoate hydroxymethyltransferase n=1 Tax=Listeria sp. PSOL-1 TaxID=1844999 RepID=UPI0013D5B824|nr:3-methyl-2-oxobutanoate hydroxymethyltransferase [Listeria sp. PSOL-1]